MNGYPIKSQSVSALHGIAFQGNVIPLMWYKTITRTLPVEGGRKLTPKPDLVAISILADIVYWYRPIAERDEETGEVIGYRQKFAADKLQRNYKAYMNMYGLGEYQVKDAFETLVNLEVVDLDFRKIDRPGKTPLQNVMYVGLNTDKLFELTYADIDMRFKPTTDGRFKPPTYTDITNNNNKNYDNQGISKNLESLTILDNQDIIQTLTPINANATHSRENFPNPGDTPYLGKGINIVDEIENENTAVALSANTHIPLVKGSSSALDSAKDTAVKGSVEPIALNSICAENSKNSPNIPGVAVSVTVPVPVFKKRGRPRQNNGTPVLSKTDLYPIKNFKHDIRPLVEAFIQETGIVPFVKDSGLWYQQANIWLKLNVTPELIKKAVAVQKERGMSIVNPKSIYWLLVNQENMKDKKKKPGMTMDDLVAIYGENAVSASMRR